MDRSVLIIDAPELSDEAVASLQEFLHEIQMVFESHYFSQLQRHYQRSCCKEDLDPLPEGKNPF